MPAHLLDDAFFPSPRRQRFQQHVVDLDLKQALRDIGIPFSLSGWDARIACPEGHSGSNTDVALRLQGERKGRWHCWSPGCPMKGFVDRLVALLRQVEWQEAERLLDFVDAEQSLVPATQGDLNWADLLQNFPTQRPIISRESMKRSPLPPGSFQGTMGVPEPLFRDTRLQKYLSSPERGFENPELIIEKYGLALGKWAMDGERKIPGFRLFIPVRDYRGCYCGWAARSLDGRKPKILYPINFTNTSVLYGEDQIEELLTWDDGNLVLVEGAFDAMKLQSLGVPALATWGAQIYEGQIRRLLEANVNRFTFAYDGDDAGREGMKLAWSAIAGRMPAWAIRFPEGKDPGQLKNINEWDRLPVMPLAMIG